MRSNSKLVETVCTQRLVMEFPLFASKQPLPAILGLAAAIK